MQSSLFLPCYVAFDCSLCFLHLHFQLSLASSAQLFLLLSQKENPAFHPCERPLDKRTWCFISPTCSSSSSITAVCWLLLLAGGREPLTFTDETEYSCKMMIEYSKSVYVSISLKGSIKYYVFQWIKMISGLTFLELTSCSSGALSLITLHCICNKALCLSSCNGNSFISVGFNL